MFKYMKIVSMLLVMLALVGCSMEKECIEVVKSKYPTSEVDSVPNQGGTVFLVRTPEGRIIYVEVMYSDDCMISQAYTAFEGTPGNYLSTLNGEPPQ